MSARIAPVKFFDLSPYFDESNKPGLQYFLLNAKYASESQEEQEQLLDLVEETVADLKSFDDDDDDDLFWGEDHYDEDTILDDLKEINKCIKRCNLHFRFLQEIIDVLISYIDPDLYPPKIINAIMNCAINMCNNVIEKMYLASELQEIDFHDAIMKAANLYRDCGEEQKYVGLFEKNIISNAECIEFAKYFIEIQDLTRANQILKNHMENKKAYDEEIYIILFNNCMALNDNEQLLDWFKDFEGHALKQSSVLKQAKIIYNYLKPKPVFDIKRYVINKILALSPEKEKKSWNSELKKVDFAEEQAKKEAERRAKEEAERKILEEKERERRAIEEAEAKKRAEAEEAKRAQEEAEAAAKQAKVDAETRAKEMADLTDGTDLKLIPTEAAGEEPGKTISAEDITVKSQEQIKEVIDKQAHKIPPHVSLRLSIQLKIDAKNYSEAYEDLRKAYMNAGDRDQVDIHHVLTRQLANKMPLDIAELYFLQCEYLYRKTKASKDFSAIAKILRKTQEMLVANNLKNLWNKDYQIFLNSHLDDNAFRKFLMEESDLQILK